MQKRHRHNNACMRLAHPTDWNSPPPSNPISFSHKVLQNCDTKHEKRAHEWNLQNIHKTIKKNTSLFDVDEMYPSGWNSSMYTWLHRSVDCRRFSCLENSKEKESTAPFPLFRTSLGSPVLTSTESYIHPSLHLIGISEQSPSLLRHGSSICLSTLASTSSIRVPYHPITI